MQPWHSRAFLKEEECAPHDGQIVHCEREWLQTDQPIADLMCSVQIYGLNKDPRLLVPDYHRKPKGWWSNPRKARPRPRTLAFPAACFCYSEPPLAGGVWRLC